MNKDLSSAMQEGALNAEENVGGVMSANEVAAHFKEPPPPPEPPKKIPQTEEERQAWEKAQNESEDIYKVAARVKNEARYAVGKNLTPTGEALCNTFVHMFVALYEFSNKIPDEKLKEELKVLIRKQEQVPGAYVAAMMAGVTAPKTRKKR